MTWVTSDPSASVKDTCVSAFVRSRWASSSGIACTLAPLIEVLEVAVASRIAGRATVSGTRVIVAVACHDQAMLFGGPSDHACTRPSADGVARLPGVDRGRGRARPRGPANPLASWDSVELIRVRAAAAVAVKSGDRRHVLVQ